MNVKTFAIAALSVVSCANVSADEKFKLDDAQLDRVTAGTQPDSKELLKFDFARTTASGKTTRGEGSLVLAAPTSEYTLYLGDGAQGSLSSLININAINSQISVLLNLNVTIDSSVGTVNQLNIQVPVPELPATGGK